MTKYEKVTKSLEICTGSLDKYSCSDCSYYNDCARTPYRPKHFLLIDTLDLLKEQEPKKVKNVVGTAVSAMGECPSCGVELNTSFLKGQRKTKFCYNCGQAVKWE